MVVTIRDLKMKYKDYGDIYGKIKRDIENEELFPLVKGLYETNKNIEGFLLASFIYGPSYLSFQYALSYHNLIPEKVVNYTNATYNKNKSKIYRNRYGTYLYRDVPKDAFKFHYIAYIHDTYSYFIATKEKAVCDMLYISPVVRSIKGIKELLFEDLRINESLFKELDFEVIFFLSEYYKSTNIKLLVSLIKKEYKI